MDSLQVTELAQAQLEAARAASHGRSARIIHGGSTHALRQTVLGLAAGSGLGEHDSPGDAMLQVLAGRVRLRAGAESWEGGAGDCVSIPARRHRLDALTDAALLLSVVTTAASGP